MLLEIEAAADAVLGARRPFTALAEER